MTSHNYDVAIVGGDTAGLSAGAAINPDLVDAGVARAMSTVHLVARVKLRHVAADCFHRTDVHTPDTSCGRAQAEANNAHVVR